MLSPALLAVALAADPFPFAAAEAEVSEAITEAELQAHVYRLASPEFLGRKGPGARRAATHLVETFQRVGLAPAFGDGYRQPVPWLVGQGESTIGENVAGMVPGSDPALRDEWVVLSAHYDHVGNYDLFPRARYHLQDCEMAYATGRCMCHAQQRFAF